jgi:hypothetical protein
MVNGNWNIKVEVSNTPRIETSIGVYSILNVAQSMDRHCVHGRREGGGGSSLQADYNPRMGPCNLRTGGIISTKAEGKLIMKPPEPNTLHIVPRNAREPPKTPKPNSLPAGERTCLQFRPINQSFKG